MIIDDWVAEGFVDEVESLKKNHGYTTAEATAIIRAAKTWRIAAVLESCTVLIDGKRFLRTTPAGGT